MIDHISIAVADLKSPTEFYAAGLGTLGMSQLIDRHGRVGFGKKYPELWLNARPDMMLIADDAGAHICLRARDEGAVRAFYRIGLERGGRSDRKPIPTRETLQPTLVLSCAIRKVTGSKRRRFREIEYLSPRQVWD